MKQIERETEKKRKKKCFVNRNFVNVINYYYYTSTTLCSNAKQSGSLPCALCTWHSVEGTPVARTQPTNHRPTNSRFINENSETQIRLTAHSTTGATLPLCKPDHFVCVFVLYLCAMCIRTERTAFGLINICQKLVFCSCDSCYIQQFPCNSLLLSTS